MRKAGNKPDGCALLVKRPWSLRARAPLVHDDGSGHVAALEEVRGPGPDGPAEGKPIVVATTHLKWDPPGTEREQRFGVRQARALCAHLQQTAAGAAWVVCGDLNVAADDDVIGVFRDAGLFDACADMPAPTCVANGRARRIDFILTTADLHAAPLPVAPIDDGSVLPSLLEPSDHVPIGVRLTTPIASPGP